jgi:hypothetical protein
MAENNKNDLGELEKLALIAESLQTMFKGRASVAFELNKEEYIKMINHFREIDRHHKQFTIDLSGTNFLFVLDEDML